jgi:outer membrane lipoprotein-sorting protein
VKTFTLQVIMAIWLLVGAGFGVTVPAQQAPAGGDSGNEAPAAQTQGEPPIRASEGSGGTGATEARIVPTSPTLAAEPGFVAPPIDEPQVTSGTLRLLRTLETFHKNVKTVRATFDQVRVDELFPDEVKSQGELWFRKPYLFRCDYTYERPMTLLILENALYMYMPDLEQVDYITFESEKSREQQLHHLLIGFGFETDELIKTYEIHSSEDELEARDELTGAGLDPAGKALFVFKPRPRFEETSPFLLLKLYIDKASHLPEKIWYLDPNDASMTLTMKKIQTDETFDDGTFDRLKLFPADVQYFDKRKTP